MGFSKVWRVALAKWYITIPALVVAIIEPTQTGKVMLACTFVYFATT